MWFIYYIYFASFGGGGVQWEDRYFVLILFVKMQFSSRHPFVPIFTLSALSPRSNWVSPPYLPSLMCKVSFLCPGAVTICVSPGPPPSLRIASQKKNRKKKIQCIL